MFSPQTGRPFIASVAAASFFLIPLQSQSAPGTSTLVPGTPRSAPACDPYNPTIDIDFRIADFQSGHWNNVSISSDVETLTLDTCASPADPDADGVGIDSGSPPLPGVDKGETFIMDLQSADGTAAFDVSGMYVSNFVTAGNGETCEVTLTHLDDTTSTFTFSRKNPLNYPTPAGDANPNNEFLVNFVADGEDPLRITRATVTASSGDCNILGFTNNPVVFDSGDCQADDLPVPGQQDPCTSTLAQGVKLDIEANEDMVGILYKEGVVIVDDPRDYCKGLAAAPEALPIDLNGGGADLMIPAQYCGYPSSDPKIHFLVLRSEVEINADVVQMILQDGDSPEYACTSDDPARRPQVLHLPNNMNSDNGPLAGPLDEIPYFDPSGSGAIHASTDNIPLPREATIGPCGSFRSTTDGYSIFAYHLRHALPEMTYTVGDPADLALENFNRSQFELGLARLQAYVDLVFPCIDRYGTGQSTLQYYLNFISDRYAQDKFEDVVYYIQGFLARLEDPTSHLYEDLRGCYYDLEFEAYPISETSTAFVEEDPDPTPGANALVPANAIGHLRADLEHLLWLSYTGAGLLHEDVPSSNTCLPYFGCPETP